MTPGRGRIPLLAPQDEIGGLLQPFDLRQELSPAEGRNEEVFRNFGHIESGFERIHADAVPAVGNEFDPAAETTPFHYRDRGHGTIFYREIGGARRSG